MRPRQLIGIAVGGAAAALVTGVVVMIAVDANTASAVVASFAIILSALALIATVRVQGSDFRAEEMVTEDVARLLASLRSVLLKLVWLTQQQDQSSERFASLLDRERSAIQAFLSSTTAHAFYAFEARKSVSAGDQPEEWRVFLLYLVEIVSLEMPGEYRVIANRAARAESLLAGLDRAEVSALSADVADLPRAIESFAVNRGNSVLGASAAAVFGSTAPGEGRPEAEPKA